MRSLGFNNVWSVVEEYVSMHSRVKCDDDGRELGADDVLTPMLTDVSEMNEWVEDSALELGDRIGDAELCNWVDDSSTTVYDRDFSDVLSDVYTEQVQVGSMGYITEEQKWLNYNYYWSRLENAKTNAELDAVRRTLMGETYTNKAGKKITLIGAQMVEGTGVYFFPAGLSKEFWAFYKERKEAIFSNQKLAVHEIEDLISDARSLARLKRIKMEIYAAKISYTEKRRLWNICDEEIDRISA